VLAAGLSLRARPARSGGPTSSRSPAAARAGRHGHAVRRPLRDVHPLRPLHPRDSGTERADGDQPRRHEEIDVFPGFPLDNKLSGNVVDLCPVGALGDKDFLYQQRVWFMKSHDNVCAGCSTGCSIKVERTRTGLSPQAARESARQPVVDVRRRPLRLEARARSAWSADRAGCFLRRCGSGRFPASRSDVRRAGRVVRQRADRLQSFKWAIRPPAGVMDRRPLYWQLGDEGPV
jgi:hypothetical protein